MAKIARVLQAEINPMNPVPEALQIIHCLIAENPGQEKAIIQGILDGLEVTFKRIEERGEKKDGK